MRRILLALIAVSMLSLSGCDYYKDTIQSESSKRIHSMSPDDLKYNLTNNVTEAVSRDCMQAEAIISYTSRQNLFVGTNTEEVKPECLGENNAIPNQGKYITKMSDIVLWFIWGMAGIVILFVTKDKLNALKAGNSHRMKNWASTLSYSLLMGLILFFISGMVITALKLTIEWGTQLQITNFKKQLYKEMSVEVPDFSAKNEKISAITEYFICIKSKDMDSKQNPSLNMYKTNSGYGYKGSYDRCSLDIAFDTDNKGNAIAKEFGIFNNYKERQGEALNTAMNKLANDGQRIADNFVKGSHSLRFGSGFDESKFICNIDSLAAINTYYFDKKELAKYKAFADNCLARNFVFALTKTPSLTMEKVDDQEVSLGHRRIHICDGSNEQKNLVTQEQITEQYKACYIKNCTDMIGSGSPYACSVALNKYFMVEDDRYQQFLLLPASDARRKMISNSSEQVLLNSFNTFFAFLEKREYAPTNKTISTIPLNSNKGLMTRQEIEEAFKESDRSVFDSITDIDFGSVIDHFSSADGLAGSNRFMTCVQFPYELKDGYDCGGIHEEFQLFGAKATVLGAQLSLGSMLHSAPDKRKRVTEDIALSGTKKLINMALGKSSNKVWAYLVPVASDGIAAAGDSIFGTKSTSLTGNYPAYYAFMILLETLPDAGKTAINIMSGMLFAIGQLFTYLLQTIELFAFLTILYKVMTDVLFNTHTIALRWMIDIDSPPEARDLDRPAIILFIEKFLFLGINVTSAYILIPSIFSGVLSVLFRNLEKFSLGLFQWSAGIVSSLLATGISVLVVIMVFKISASLLSNMSKYFDTMYFGELAAHDVRTQGLDEQKAIAKAYKGKYFN